MYSEVVSKGNNWIKWDCHVHTPKSYQNEFGEFDSYVRELKKMAKLHRTDVVIINDYFTLDGYKELINNYCKKDEDIQSYYIELEDDKRLYILPGMELRIDNFTDENAAINLHIFFNQNLPIEQIEENFIYELKTSKNGNEINLNKENIIRLGYAIEKGEDYKQGLDISKFGLQEKEKYTNTAYKNITLNYKEVVDAKQKFESKFYNDEKFNNNCALIVLPFKGHGSVGDVEKKEWDGRLNMIKKDILSIADVCYASNEKDISFLLGNSHGTSKEEIIKIFRSIKPCVWGSDAHKSENLCYPSNGKTKKYTWIKCMPNFDGIKQILFEPESRVKIQEQLPEIKIEYRIIEKVKFVSDDIIYPTKEINLNQNLNTIIGGKSSGKSLLLNSIASTVAGDIRKFQYNKLKERYSFDFEVYWKDGEINRLSSTEDRTRKVKYINQMYITQFIDKSEKLDDEVLNILLENKEIEEISEAFKIQRKAIDDCINSLIFELEQNIKDKLTIQNEFKTVGKYEVIEEELQKLTKRKEDIVKESSMSEEDMKVYFELNQKNDTLGNKINTITTKYLDVIEKHIQYLEKIKNPMKNWLNQKENDDIGNEDDTEKCYIDVYTNVFKALNSGLEKLSEKKKEHLKEIENIELEKRTLLTKIEPYSDKMKQKNVVQDIDKEIEKQKQLSLKSTDLNNKIQDKEEEIRININKIGLNLQKRIDIYNEFVNKFTNKNSTNLDKDMEITCNVAYKYEELEIKITDILKKNSTENKILIQNSCENNILENHIDKIVEIISNAIEEKYVFKAAYDKYDLIRAFVEDYYKFKFDIVEQETSFFDMSPGKQGLVLLKLILHMSNETYPILLDQPEDNLDNRTISTELKEFIKNKKISRQILMVTHNANLAVLTDSEEIIVANQRGINIDEQDTLFDYVTGPIEYSFIDKNEKELLYNKGIKEHICEVLEGGVEAFKAREDKYEINRMMNRIN